MSKGGSIIFKEIPFLRFLIALIPGIFFAYKSEFDWTFFHGLIISISTIFISLFVFVPSFYKNYKIRWLSGFFAVLFLFSAGWLLTRNAFPSKIDDTYNITAIGKIKTVENRHEKWVRINFIPETIDNDSVPIKKGDIWLLIIRNDLEENILEAGKKIAIKGNINGHSKPINPDAFDYGAYLFRKKVSGQMFLESDNIVVLDEKSNLTFFDLAEKIRTFLADIFVKSNKLNSSSTGIITALILGDRSGIDRELNDSFVRSGAVHILAVSGLHVGIIYLIINFILNYFFKPASKKRMFVVIALLFFYAFITGFSPSVSRAVFMFSLMQFGKSMAKSANTYNTLSASGFFLLLIDPMFLFNVGFWLSHLAVAGIVAFTEHFENILNYNILNENVIIKKSLKAPIWLLRKIWTIISVSFAAQLGILPIMLYLFGAFPIYFLITNICVLPIVAPIIITGLSLLVLSWIPLLSDIIAYILNLMLIFMERFVTYIDALPYSYIEGIWVSIPLMIFLYFMIIIGCKMFDFVTSKRLIRFLVATIFAILIINIQFFTKIKDRIVVFNTGNNALIELTTNGICTSFSSEGLSDKNRNFASYGHNLKNVIRTENHIILCDTLTSDYPSAFLKTINNTNILLLSGGTKKIILNEFENSIDILIIYGKINLDPKTTIEKLNCKTIVFASNCPRWIISRWIKDLENSNLHIHNVKNDGAFVADLSK
ncbi:MAG: ComEC family competence protein [Marinilabiliaceae bacterium]|nr:ComEC family competence protein [Marinilabiliaceae bacterium]